MPEALKSRRLVTATAVALLATLAATLSFALYQARNSELDDWRSQLANTSLLLAQQASNEMAAADLVLDGMLERIASLHVADDAQLRAQMGGSAEFHGLVARKKALPQIDVASITDSAGNVVAFTRTHPTPRINLADRDYFLAHRDHPGLASFVSRPVRNKGNGEWTFYLSRRISAPDGRFLGVVLVGLSSRRLSEFFSKVNLGNGATVTLYRRDFTTLARWPHDDARIGVVERRDASYDVVERQQRDQGVLVLDGDAGVQREARMAAVRVIPNYPMLINVAVTETLFMQQWRGFAWQLAIMGAACSLAVAAAYIVLLREMGRRDSAVRQQRALKAQADAANRAKGDFLAMISHEIRTPLTAVIGFAGQLEHAANQHDAAELGSVIARNGQMLLALINDILDMSKTESGMLELERVAFAPGEALAAVELLMSGQARQKGLGFATRLAQDCPPAVLGDPTRWRQILLNLVSNAIKFTERGEVTVQVWWEPAGERLHCRVSDSGIGMDASQLAQLFTPFGQADSTISRRFGGTGLGLYLVRQLARAMDGDASVDSRPGEGTRITVVVHAPLAGAGLPATPVVAAVPAGPRTGRVLLVEDGADNRRLITAMLQQCGLTVLAAADGRQGVAMALAERPDLVLMDIQMPVLDGVAALRQLQARGFAAPIVALTANVMPADLDGYLAAGFAAWVAKPIDRQAFDAMLARFLPSATAALPPAGGAFSALPEYAGIRAAFVGCLAARVTALREALGNDDLTGARMAAHMLKGSAATFGCPAVGVAAAALEQAAAAADMVACHAALAALAAAARTEAPAAFLEEHE